MCFRHLSWFRFFLSSHALPYRYRLQVWVSVFKCVEFIWLLDFSLSFCPCIFFSVIQLSVSVIHYKLDASAMKRLDELVTCIVCVYMRARGIFEPFELNSTFKYTQKRHQTPTQNGQNVERSLISYHDQWKRVPSKDTFCWTLPLSMLFSLSVIFFVAGKLSLLGMD